MQAKEILMWGPSVGVFFSSAASLLPPPPAWWHTSDQRYSRSCCSLPAQSTSASPAYQPTQTNM
eukprot:6627431-Pyramimonas_sp.AAC.1